ncbi:MAG: hypothetical protein LC659_02230, partial [Myxococcales bacterium]|nr:hypothetical protein [Myxococcales bacterium]
ERRQLSPFGWAGNARRVDEPAPAIGRADFRLSDLETRALLPDDACAKFGPIGASAAARASELIVLLHGWACTRTVWHELALAICRDNADALVLVPDVNGFGESRLDAATVEQLRPKALGSAILYWLSLMGLRDLPGARPFDVGPGDLDAGAGAAGRAHGTRVEPGVVLGARCRAKIA